MLWVKWPVVDTIYRLSKFARGVKIKVTGEFKLNNSPVAHIRENPPRYLQMR